MHYLFVLLALEALLVVHELGHLIAARLLGVPVPRFTLGFGPPVLSFGVGGTRFIVGAVPLGAAAHLQGMNPHRADAAEETAFDRRRPWRRLLIILAGPLANYVVAVGILLGLYLSGTHVVVPLTVGTVLPGSEAARAQLLPGDRIVHVDGKALSSWSEFVERMAQGTGRALTLGVDRHGEAREVTVRPRSDERGQGRIGVSQQYVYRTHAPGEALRQAFVHTGNVAAEGLATMTELLQGHDAGPGGPGALMRQESTDVATSDVDALLRALVAASVALALLTLIPVPGLDGGRVLLLLIEAVSGRRLPTRVETLAQTLGFLALASAIVLMAGAEIRRALPSVRLSMFATATNDGGATASVDAGMGATGVAALRGDGDGGVTSADGGTLAASTARADAGSTDAGALAASTLRSDGGFSSDAGSLAMTAAQRDAGSSEPPTLATSAPLTDAGNASPSTLITATHSTDAGGAGTPSLAAIAAHVDAGSSSTTLMHTDSAATAARADAGSANAVARIASESRPDAGSPSTQHLAQPAPP
ncbi:peptidase M50 [Corallococcus sp. H22C18031201]|nr:peptidase M50 [Corallococcus sp. H22C18031201]